MVPVGEKFWSFTNNLNCEPLTKELLLKQIKHLEKSAESMLFRNDNTVIVSPEHYKYALEKDWVDENGYFTDKFFQDVFNLK